MRDPATAFLLGADGKVVERGHIIRSIELFDGTNRIAEAHLDVTPTTAPDGKRPASLASDCWT